MSTEQGVGEIKSSEVTSSVPLGSSPEERDLKHTTGPSSHSQRTSPPKLKEEGESAEEKGEGKASISGPIDTGKAQATQDDTAHTLARIPETEETPRQVIAVSASKGPAAFFNLARKFLVTDEMCDLSALEGAIVSAVDAAHLLERSQLATIVRIQTSYVTVEPKRRKQPTKEGENDEEAATLGQPKSTPSEGASNTPPTPDTAANKESRIKSEGAQRRDDTSTQSVSQPARQSGSKGSSGGRELRRARIVITVRRTESYKRWLDENPLQSIIAEETDDAAIEQAPGNPKPHE